MSEIQDATWLVALWKEVTAFIVGILTIIGVNKARQAGKDQVDDTVTKRILQLELRAVSAEIKVFVTEELHAVYRRMDDLHKTNSENINAVSRRVERHVDSTRRSE